MKIKKTPAFTLLEMIVSLTITSIIISLVYLTINILNKQLFLYIENTTTVNQFNQINTAIIRDLFNAKNIIKKKNKLIFVENNNVSVTYLFNSNSIKRVQENIIDTYKKGELLVGKIPEDNFGNFVFVIKYSLFNQNITNVYSKKMGIEKKINLYYLNEN